LHYEIKHCITLTTLIDGLSISIVSPLDSFTTIAYSLPFPAKTTSEPSSILSVSSVSGFNLYNGN